MFSFCYIFCLHVKNTEFRVCKVRTLIFEYNLDVEHSKCIKKHKKISKKQPGYTLEKADPYDQLKRWIFWSFQIFYLGSAKRHVFSHLFVETVYICIETLRCVRLRSVFLWPKKTTLRKLMYIKVKKSASM